MSKKNKYIICALLAGAALMFALGFIVGSRKSEFTVTFDSDGGSHVSLQVISEGDKVTKPTDPTKENYIFLRWEYKSKEYDFSAKVTEDMTLKAIWEEKAEPLFDVEFVVNGVSKVVSLSRITENDLAALGFEEKAGYEIKWYVDDKEYDFNEPVTATMKLTGKYVKTTLFTIKFNSDGGTEVTSQKVKQNEKVIEPELITKHGFIFDGWYLNNTAYDFNTPVTKNITLVAKWKEDTSVKRYEVTFDSDGGSKVDKQRVVENEKAIEPKVPTKEEYKFLGWYLNNKLYDFKSKVTGNITLKAKWEKNVQYTVTFNKDNGTSDEIKKVTSGEKVTRPANPTKTGARFEEWLYNNKAFDFNTPITSDITLVARYTNLQKFTVTFNSNGGTNVTSQSVYDGDKATRPSDPTKDDNDFVEWQLNGSKYDFNKAVTGDITLTAKWTEKSHTYTVIVTRVDNFSPDSRLTVKKDGTAISFMEIKYTDGTHLCSGSKPVVTTADLNGETALLVKINDSKEVRATIVR